MRAIHLRKYIHDTGHMYGADHHVDFCVRLESTVDVLLDGLLVAGRAVSYAKLSIIISCRGSFGGIVAYLLERCSDRLIGASGDTAVSQSVIRIAYSITR